jgi:hypothetical protein
MPPKNDPQKPSAEPFEPGSGELPAEQERDLEELEDQENAQSERSLHEMQQVNAAVTSSVAKQASKVDAVTQHDQGLAAVTAANSTVIPSGDAAGAGDPEYERLKEAIKDVLADNKVNKTTCQKFVGFLQAFLAIAADLTTLFGIWAIVISVNSTRDEERLGGVAEDDDPNLAAMRMLVQAWQGLAPETFWASFKRFVVSDPYITINDQMVYLQLVIQASAYDPVFWASDSDRLAIASAVSAAWTGPGMATVSDIYPVLAQQTYKGQPLPQASAARVGMIALQQILEKMEA